jgi:Holliday junction resolvase RusA-like endonuclease
MFLFNLKFSEVDSSLERDIKREIKKQLDFPFPTLLKGPLCIHFSFYVPTPNKFCVKKREHIRKGNLYPNTTHPLVPLKNFYINLLVGLVIKDDSQVVEIHAKKFYGEKPHTVIRIDEIP